MNASAVGRTETFEWKSLRLVREFWSRLTRWRSVDSCAPDSSEFYLQGVPIQHERRMGAEPDAEATLKAPHRVQVCDLTKSEAEELLDCLENERGPYLFVECTLGPRGYTVSYLTRRWRPQPPFRKAQRLNSPACKVLGLPERVGMASCRVQV